MKGSNQKTWIAGITKRHSGLAGLLAAAALVLVSGGPWGASVTNAASPAGSAPAKTASQQAPDTGQIYADVPQSNSFYSFIQSISVDNIVSGYPCGGPNEPCDAQNRPYYRPGAGVTRGQMAKFVDNGRRNIDDAIGNSLFISTTVPTAIQGQTRSGGEGVTGYCLTPNSSCWAVHGQAPTGDYAGQFNGGRGLFAQSSDAGEPGVGGSASGFNGPGGEFSSGGGNGLIVDAPPAGNLFYPMMVNGTGNANIAERIFDGALLVDGNLQVNGSKSGYVVDAMQNADNTPLEPGDVVIIVGSTTPIMGEIPVITVKKADQAYDTRAAGIVDQMLYVPDAATRDAFEKQEQAQADARAKRNQLLTGSADKGDGSASKPDLSQVPIPPSTISEQDGTIHALADAKQAAPGTYLNVVTLGAYKGIKVDASFGAIHAGDLLTTSPHAGYAMKVSDKSQAFGAVIGKALADLNSGTGIIPVTVTLK